MVEQRRPSAKALEVGAQAEVEDLPRTRAEARGLRLHEALDRFPPRILHHVNMVGGRGDRQDRGKGVIEEEPQPRGRELFLQGRPLRLAQLLPVKPLDRGEILELRRTDLDAHRRSPSSERKY